MTILGQAGPAPCPGRGIVYISSMIESKQNRKAVAGRIVVAMSGGVDSSVTAALLAEQGHDVVGITLQLYDHGAAIQRKNACCAGQDIDDARRVAERIGIPHYMGFTSPTAYAWTISSLISRWWVIVEFD